MELIKSLSEATEARLQQHGQLKYFEANAFASALEQEINKAHERNQQHMRVEMNLEDADRLARFIRRAVLLGA